MPCHRETFRKCYQESYVYDGFVKIPVLKAALTSSVQLHAALKRLGSLPEALLYNARRKLAIEKLVGSFWLHLGLITMA